jgi:hypothetical protein
VILNNEKYVYPIIYNNKKAQEILAPKVDPWIQTPHKGYVNVDPKQKGAYGEEVTFSILSNLGHNIEPRTNSGHDGIVNVFKTEVKFSLANRYKGIVQPNCFIFNHFSIGKDWERAILIGSNPHTTHIVWFTRDDLESYLLGPNIFFNRQQSGAKGNNDDWMYNSKSKKRAWPLFINLPWVKSLEEW